MKSNFLKVVKKADILGMILDVYGDIENPLFLAKDIAERIEHKDVSVMTRNLEEKTEKLNQTLFVSGQNREVTLLTEDGVYEVLMTSRKPVAKEFRKGFKEFLKAWRKGEVKVVEQRAMTTEEMIIAQAQSVIEVKSRVDKLEKIVDNTLTIDHSKQRQMQIAISRKVYKRIEERQIEGETDIPKTKMFSGIYREIKNKFGVASYRDILIKDFENAMKFIEGWIENKI